ncbi:sensor histidine kinase [Actinomadura verrucosospora]|uniref:Two component signal transduction histidine kinase n=1 Tax=Actinomadura verrucosospora TaxID=46165 RepID=A0A7D3VPY2_ACTVE|nr:sensor histidine kinase [Actinomadura verrucosospora]QKG19900.1 two component signal transduction histidine kinase [Actinomadura verrucosospora]
MADLQRPPVGLDRAALADDGLSAEIGGTRAMTGVNPVESLEVASVLFAVVMEHLGPHDPQGRTAVALSEVLHTAIMRRVGVASVAYASFLLRKVHGAHLSERRRMARRLHDLVAHEVGVGLQNLELFEMYRDDPAQAATKLETARESLHAALRTARSLSAEMGTTVGADGLVAALTKYLSATRPQELDVRFASVGDDRVLPETHSEELYLVLREAVRNALLHGRPATIEVRLDFSRTELQAVVRDDGLGFDVDEVLAGPDAVGLTSMRERMELLGGTLALTSAKGQGTTVDARLELVEFG